MTKFTLEESLSMFMAEIAKRVDENTNLIRELRASTDFALRNQKASIKALEIQVRQMSIILHEKLSRDLRSSTEIMPRVNDETISTSVKTDKLSIRHIDASQYADELKETDGEKYPEGHYTNAKLLVKALPRKEKYPGRLGDLIPTKLIVELADRTVKRPKGIVENVLVGPHERKSTNVDGEFTNLEILKCWSLENSRRLFNTNSCSINLHGESPPSKYQGSFSF
ncbi:hypothetical protein Tco_1020663 [Tanacetum coccineum]